MCGVGAVERVTWAGRVGRGRALIVLTGRCGCLRRVERWWLLLSGVDLEIGSDGYFDHAGSGYPLTPRCQAHRAASASSQASKVFGVSLLVRVWG